MTAPDIALAASARNWPDQLHRFVLDHGGGRIVDRVMGPDQAAETPFDILVIDDVCSFLTPRLVDVVKSRGSEVLGVNCSVVRNFSRITGVPGFARSRTKRS